MEVDVEFFRESGWGPWVAFALAAIAFYALWEFMIAIRNWRSRSRGPWSKSSAGKQHAQSSAGHHSTLPSYSSTPVTRTNTDGQVLNNKSDQSGKAAEPRAAKSNADLLRMDANRRRKQREHRLNLKSQGCDWIEDADDLHEGKIRWICRACGAYAFTFNEDEPTTCRKHEPRQGL